MRETTKYTEPSMGVRFLCLIGILNRSSIYVAILAVYYLIFEIKLKPICFSTGWMLQSNVREQDED